ncbi:M24 family metallopeptidase, partial [candidate division GN15 bacterium]|nr:M24 family metallopeptidase [candidate division GN15 bacterium]
ARKTTAEVDRLSTSAMMATDVWREAAREIRPGLTEKQIAGIIEQRIADLRGTPSFETIVNAGAKTNPGHGHPTDAVLEPGDLLHVDFGVFFDDYCSDIQRLLYVRREGEAGPPETLTRAFDSVAGIITSTAELCRPGMKGFEVDAEARRILREAGYEEYQHALGHQLGRSVHDGGAILGPQWERYGVTPTLELELNNVFTLELEIMLPDIGCVGLEEDVCIKENGARFLCPRQMELVIL